MISVGQVKNDGRGRINASGNRIPVAAAVQGVLPSALRGRGGITDDGQCGLAGPAVAATANT